MTYARARRSRGTRHFCRFATHSKLGLRVARCTHVGELVRALFAEVIEASRKHDLGLARQQSITGDLDRLEGRGTGADRDLDGAAGRQQQEVDPTSGGVDEAGTTDEYAVTLSS